MWKKPATYALLCDDWREKDRDVHRQLFTSGAAWVGGTIFEVKEDLNCNAIDAKYLSVDGRYVARNGPGPRFVVVARK